MNDNKESIIIFTGFSGYNDHNKNPVYININKNINFLLIKQN